MFQRVKQRIRDAETIKLLCEQAERHAADDGQQEPGAEHFLLSALDLPDGSARRALERLQVEPAAVRDAIAEQYAQALRAIGVDPAALNAVNDDRQSPPPQGLFRASPSGQAVMKALAQRREHDKNRPLLGAHVVAVVASMKQGVAARTLRAMGVDLDALASAASDEIEASCRQPAA